MEKVETCNESVGLAELPKGKGGLWLEIPHKHREFQVRVWQGWHWHQGWWDPSQPALRNPTLSSFLVFICPQLKAPTEHMCWNQAWYCGVIHVFLPAPLCSYCKASLGFTLSSVISAFHPRTSHLFLISNPMTKTNQTFSCYNKYLIQRLFEDWEKKFHFLLN